jgi:hypothetical protein
VGGGGRLKQLLCLSGTSEIHSGTPDLEGSPFWLTALRS